jgi:hypothetical protein
MDHEPVMSLQILNDGELVQLKMILDQLEYTDTELSSHRDGFEIERYAWMRMNDVQMQMPIYQPCLHETDPLMGFQLRMILKV